MRYILFQHDYTAIAILSLSPDMYKVPTECSAGVKPGVSLTHVGAEVEVSEVDC